LEPTTRSAKPWIATNFHCHETGDEYFDYWGAPAQGRFTISGLAVPDEILEKLYHKNAEHLFSQWQPEP
jgi:hypothetical protein